MKGFIANNVARLTICVALVALMLLLVTPLTLEGLNSTSLPESWQVVVLAAAINAGIVGLTIRYR